MSEAITPPVIDTKTKYVLDDKADLEKELERLGKKYTEMSEQFNKQKATQKIDENIAQRFADMSCDIAYEFGERDDQEFLYVFDRFIDERHLIISYNKTNESVLIVFDEKVVIHKYGTGKIFAYYKNKNCFDILEILHLKVKVEEGISKLENIETQFSDLTNFYNPRLTKELKEEFNL